MSEKLLFTPEAASMAVFQSITQLIGVLGAKKLLTIDDSNYVFAAAASASRGAGSEDAARLIEAAVPSSKGFDLLAHAKSLGAVVVQKE